MFYHVFSVLFVFFFFGGGGGGGLYTFPPPNWIVAVPHLAATWTNEDFPDSKVRGVLLTKDNPYLTSWASNMASVVRDLETIDRALTASSCMNLNINEKTPVYNVCSRIRAFVDCFSVGSRCIPWYSFSV